MMPVSGLRMEPGLYVLLPLMIGMWVIAAIILMRWFMSRDAWGFHPEGAGGFLQDEFMRLGAVFVPYLLIGVAVRYYFFVLHPEMLHSPYLFGFLIGAVVLRRFARSLSFVQFSAQRIEAARLLARYERGGV